MKKENVTISFESEQLAALEFSLKKKNTSVQAQLEELLKCLYESEVPEVSGQPRGARCPSPPSSKAGEAAAAGGASLCVGAAH